MHGGVLGPDGEVQGGEPLVLTGQELLEYDKFLEDRRTRRLVAEAGGQLTVVDIGGDKPVGITLPPQQSRPPQKNEASKDGKSDKKDSTDDAQKDK